MIRVLYFSTASADLRQDDVDQIVAHAKTANVAREVTGALAYNGRNFCQVLEGDADVVHDLIAKIAKDPRHSGFKILDEKPIDARYFEDWSLKRVRDLNFDEVINAMNA